MSPVAERAVREYLTYRANPDAVIEDETVAEVHRRLEDAQGPTRAPAAARPAE